MRADRKFRPPEHALLKLISNLHAAGLSRAEIASRLDLSPGVVSARFKQLGISQKDRPKNIPHKIQSKNSAKFVSTVPFEEAWWKQNARSFDVGMRRGLMAEMEQGSWIAEQILATLPEHGVGG